MLSKNIAVGRSNFIGAPSLPGTTCHAGNIIHLFVVHCDVRSPHPVGPSHDHQQLQLELTPIA